MPSRFWQAFVPKNPPKPLHYVEQFHREQRSQERRARRIVNEDVLVDRERKERRSWYESYLLPYTMTTSETDFFHIREDLDQEGASIFCQATDEGSCKQLRLPVGRCVEASCSICCDDFKQGQKAVWSSEEDCKHVFHEDCILPWLERGKKRCPVCRQCFVPGGLISEQKKEKARKEMQLASATKKVAESVTLDSDSSRASVTDELVA